jgi:DNA gyrase/topoisomerase IV subunit A
VRRVGERSGLGVVEVVILEALDAAGARPDDRHVRSARVLAAVDERIGLGPGYAYPVLTDLALPWKVPVPLVDPCGNFGSRDGDPPAIWRYTEARLSPAGQAALAAERGQTAPVPVGLINGNTCQWGTRPPFRPAAVIDAIRQVIARPEITSRQIAAIVGPPDFMTGCTVTGDLAGLAAGRPVDLRLDARVTVTDEARLSARVPEGGAGSFLSPERNRTLVVVDNLPPIVSVSEAARAIANRARKRRWAPGHPGLDNWTRLPVMDVLDLSARGDYLVACVPKPGAAPEELRRQLLEIEGVTTTIPAALPQPLGTMIRDWARAFQDEDLPGSLTALENAIGSGRPYDGR